MGWFFGRGKKKGNRNTKYVVTERGRSALFTHLSDTSPRSRILTALCARDSSMTAEELGAACHANPKQMAALLSSLESSGMVQDVNRAAEGLE